MKRLSLRARLFLLLIIPLCIVSAAAATARYIAAAQLSQRLYDDTLLVVALTISRDVVISEGDLLTERLLDELIHALGDPVFYRITGPEGSFVTGYSDPPKLPADADLNAPTPFFFDSISQGVPVRAVALREFISEPQFGGWVTVEVWQNVTQRAGLSQQLLGQSLLLLGTLIVTAALILWFGIQLGLKPLLDLREAISLRSADDLRPIRRWVPPELRPLVDTTNSLFSRLSNAFSIRDAFISDAAHQIRNPIAAIQSQAEAARTAPTEPLLRQRISEVADSARAAGRLTNQLLSMERIRGRSLRSHFLPCDLVEITSNRVRRFAEIQLRRDVAVSFNVTGTPQPVNCDPVMIEEMLVNLLDNAAAYGLQPGGMLEVTLAYGPEDLCLTLQDDGPGIPLMYVDRVFDRFFRIEQGHDSGCGLGLSIVADVAAAHGGKASCRPVPRGACFSVSLPLRAEAKFSTLGNPSRRL
jgi:two-component system, OmpR family, sensor histidine kinase TctE